MTKFERLNYDVQVAAKETTNRKMKLLQAFGWRMGGSIADLWLWQKQLPDGRIVCVSEADALHLTEFYAEEWEEK